MPSGYNIQQLLLIIKKAIVDQSCCCLIKYNKKATNAELV